MLGMLPLESDKMKWLQKLGEERKRFQQVKEKVSACGLVISDKCHHLLALPHEFEFSFHLVALLASKPD